MSDKKIAIAECTHIHKYLPWSLVNFTLNIFGPFSFPIKAIEKLSVQLKYLIAYNNQMIARVIAYTYTMPKMCGSPEKFLNPADRLIKTYFHPRKWLYFCVKITFYSTSACITNTNRTLIKLERRMKASCKVWNFWVRFRVKQVQNFVPVSGSGRVGSGQHIMHIPNAP